MTLQTASIIFGFGVIMLVLGLIFKKYAPGLLGSILIFLLGLNMMVTPLENITSNMNSLVSVTVWGLGAYFFLTGAYEYATESGLIP